MDERLAIPKALGPINQRSLHYGHPGRDSMLVTVANVWCHGSTEKWWELLKRANSVKHPVRTSCPS